eukprot:TRINITY_DN48480_c0_g1_i1.p1 TRINITY_DN48480_c0_g1~~TRINITY_DN48480_c0_g1_i1.p1  ORF type:complete len:853 (-),score=173.97 TRINITY_DN48480_c0_g1_i1:260-2509(-)
MNTCRNFKHLLGQPIESPAVECERFWSTCPLAADADGLAGYKVRYKGREHVFSAVSVTAMFLTKLKDITREWCQGEVVDAVVAVPSYFTDSQRTALLDAAKVANLNVLRVMNEHTATALSYGYYRSSELEEGKSQTVAICCMGHVVFSVSIVQFFKNKLSVICEKSEKVGGRDMDECLMRVFAKQFEKKTGNEPLSNKKAAFKLEDAVTKTKKILSANSEAGISVECLMEDEDFSSQIDRALFLEMCEPMMKKVSGVLEAAKTMAGPLVDNVHAVEMCGGASRVPWVKEMCSKAFGGKELSMTMNADECVARGCGVQAAILSTLYKARDYEIEDTTSFPVSLSWAGVPAAVVNGDNTPQPPERSAVVFPQNSLTNTVKVMTLFRKDTFEVKARYGNEAALPEGISHDLGTYKIELPAQQEAKKVKVKAALSVHGTFSIESAQLVEDFAGDCVENDNGSNADGGDGKGNKSADDEAVATRNDVEASSAGSDVKRPAKDEARGGIHKRRRTNLVVTSTGCPGMSAEKLRKHTEEEEAMRADMKEVIDSSACRNDLEAYIFSMRSSVAENAKFGEYVTQAERNELVDILGKAEDWLYDHVDDVKQAFVEKLADLKRVGERVETRFKESERRPGLVAELEKAAKRHRVSIQKVAQKGGIADASRLGKLDTACDSVLTWLAGMRAKQASVAKNEDPVLCCAHLEEKATALTALAEEVLGDLVGSSDEAVCVSVVPPGSPAPMSSPAPPCSPAHS